MSLNAFNPAMPEDCIKSLWKKIPRHIFITFIAACISGLFAHFYMFTDKMLNLDDIGALFGNGYGTASGRWLLPFLTDLDGNFSAPWLIGALSILILAVAACLVVSIMRVKRPLSCILTAAIMVTFPTVTSTMAYMFSADAYFMALAFACFAAYITQKYRWGVLPGAVAVAFSMGIYQSYFSVAAVLLVGVLLLDTLDGKDSFKTLLLRGVKFVATLGAGMVAYMVIVKVTTRSVELVNYMGISDMGKLSLSDLPRLISSAYLKYGDFFLFNDPAAHFSFLKYLFLLTALATVGLVVFILLRRKLNPAQLVLLALLALVYPLAGNIVYVMVPSAPIHVLMLYGMFAILLAPIALMEYAANLPVASAERKKISLGGVLRTTCCWVIAVTMGLTAYSYTIFSNDIYLKLDMTYEQTYAFSSRLLSAIESLDGYAPALPVVLVGTALGQVENPTPELSRLALTGVGDMRDMVNSYTYGYYLRRFHAASNVIHTDFSEIAKEFAKHPQVQTMPSYPSNNSIQIVDGHIIVKFS